MTNPRTLLAQALEFAEFCWREVPLNDCAEEKREALEQSIRAHLAAEPVEPVAVVAMDVSKAHLSYGTQYLGQKPDTKTVMMFKDLDIGTFLYAAAPPAPAAVPPEPLTPAQIDAIWSGMGSFTDSQSDYRLFARAVERAHGIGASDETT